jgi:hypothetical protein
MSALGRKQASQSHQSESLYSSCKLLSGMTRSAEHEAVRVLGVSRDSGQLHRKSRRRVAAFGSSEEGGPRWPAALPGAPLQRRAGGGSARRVVRREANQLGVSPWMDCRQTPEPGREPCGQDVRKARKRGGLLFGSFLLATQEKGTRPPQGGRKLLHCMQLKHRPRAGSYEIGDATLRCGRTGGQCPPNKKNRVTQCDKSIA